MGSLDPTSVKIYTVNGPTAGSSSALPDWLTLKRTQKRTHGGRAKRVTREHVESQVELIQGFEFPEACNKVKATRDGKHVVAIGTYKPQIRVWDLAELTMKFERHTDAEGVDFVMLSDDWTKSIHLQNDRSLELHTQGGFHYRTRIPRFGRTLAYHFPSCDTYVGATGNEVYRLNLNQGRFMTPITLDDSDDGGGGGGDIDGVNCVDVNTAHQLLAFGLDGTPSVHFYDPRSRARAGLLRVPVAQLLPPSLAPSHNLPGNTPSLSITALSSRFDGLTYAVGTSTGHTLLYDIRSDKHYAIKDQGYGLPVKNVEWIRGGERMAGDGLVLSADKKVVKVWDRQDPSTNFLSLTPAADLNHVHHVPGSGVLFAASEGIALNTYFIPQLGPAPRWAPFLENITEEMEGRATRSVYEDYKFVERKELAALGLDNLVGTPTLKPYMHGYFVSLKLYETARLITNPFAYQEHRERTIRDKMEKLAETRIRSGPNAKRADALKGVTVNQALATKILKEEEKERKRAEKRQARAAAKAAQTGDDAEAAEGADEGDHDSDKAMHVDDEEEASDAEESGKAKNLLTDSRFSALFSNPAFTVDETSREFAMLNPSTVARQNGATSVPQSRRREVESDDEDEDGSGSGSDEEDDATADENDSDSDNEALTHFDPRTNPGVQNARMHALHAERSKRGQQQRASSGPKLVPLQASGARGSGSSRGQDSTFGQRKSTSSSMAKGKAKASTFDNDDDALGGAMEVTWTPSSSSTAAVDADDGAEKGQQKHKRGKGSETFGAGMERVGEMEWEAEQSQSSGGGQGGRTSRRKGVRSGSRNAFRKI